MNRDLLVRVFLVVGIGLVMSVGAWLFSSRTRIAVTNETGGELAGLVISFPGQVCTYASVPLHALRTCEGRADGDGSIVLEFRQGSGAEQKLVTDTYLNPTFGWRGAMILRAPGTVDVQEEH
ncbi:hypothetical protein [Corallococcus terminator]|nr:hypothetical protein [Corallococcus terminator]